MQSTKPFQNTGESSVFALLAAVSCYDDGISTDLPSGRADLELMRNSLKMGLRIPEDHIRSMGENGRVTVRGFARALGEFSSLSRDEDIFLLYFSGHGSHDCLLFSDGAVAFDDLSGILSKMAPKAKVLILDCCHAGAAPLPSDKRPGFEGVIDDFAGRGAAVLASSAPDELSYMDPGGEISLYTGAVCAAMLSRRKVRAGMLSLFDLSESIRENMAVLNRTRDKEMVQHPYFRSGMGGTLFFRVSDDRPYQPGGIHLKGNGYELLSVKSLSTGNTRRFAAFLVTDTQMPLHRIREITEEISEKIRNLEIAVDEHEAERLRGTAASVIWCYFGCSRRDMLGHNYYVRSIYAWDEEQRQVHYRADSGWTLAGGVCIWKNPSYDLIRAMESPSEDAEAYCLEIKKLLALVLSQAEQFISALNECMNGVLGLAEFRRQFREWYREVYRVFIRITDTPAPPDALKEWSLAVLDLAGWVPDMAVLMEENSVYDDKTAFFLAKQAARHYYLSIEKLREIENRMKVQS